MWRMAWRPAPHRGFSLVELTILVAIAGIIAAISIPTYQHYVVKSQIGRAFREAAAYKNPVEERLRQGVNRFPNPADSLGYFKSSLTATASTFAFNANGSGSIAVTLDGDVHPLVRGTRITLGRLADGSWNCTVRGGTADITAMHVPLSCSLETGS